MDDFGRRQASIKNVLICGICKKLCKNVTIIEECCHRFCKKVITRKITEEELNVCPECNVDLGIAPLQKIRPDHQMQEIMEILSAKRKEYIARGLIKDQSKKDESKKSAQEEIGDNSSNMLIDNPPVPPPPAVTTSSRRKEKSISSLVNTTPPLVGDDHDNVLSSRGIRRRDNPRNANVVRFQDSSKFNNVVDQLTNNQIKPGSSTIPLVSQQVIESSAAESSKKNKSSEPLDRMNELWEPLHNLGTKGVTLDNSKSTEPVPKFTPILINLDEDDDEDGDEDDDDEDKEYVPSPKIKEHRVHKQNVVQKSNVVPAAAAASNNAKEKGKKGRRGRKKKETNNIPPLPLPPPAASGDGESNNNNNVAQGGVTHHHEAAATSSGARVHPIWFTLLASDNQECPSPLPQISPPYIKIKDVNKPASYIKKYLAKKLSLQSEDEVEVRMLGMPIRPALPLQHLADMWLRVAESSNSTTDKIVKVGDSAEDFVIVFKYSHSQNPQLN